MGQLTKKNILKHLHNGSLENLLSFFDKASIFYVSWKNNHELNIALSGDGDLDIFVPLQYKSSVITFAEHLGWVRLENPVARFPWVTHLYNLDQDNKQHHLHIYFRVVTGESWLKEYVLPLDNWLISNRIRDKQFNIWVLNNQAQAFIFALRHLLKGASLSSRLLYRSEFDSYSHEWQTCATTHKDLAKIADSTIDFKEYLIGSGLTGEILVMPKFVTSIQFRLSLFPFLRLPWWSLPIRRIISFVKRVANKFLLKRKKILPNSGLIIAISGVDGAGKSTMLNEAYRIFSRFLTVERFSLGKPQGYVIESLHKLFKNKFQWNKDANKNSTKLDKDNTISAKQALSAVILSLLRLHKARRVQRTAFRGHLALVDRWPTDEFGKMDGPKLSSKRHSGSFVAKCMKIESWAYARIPKADICFFLQVPIKTAIIRNRERTKVDKETDEEIFDRYSRNQNFKPIVNKLIMFDNNGSFDEKRKDFLLCIWKEIAKHQ